MTRPPTRGSTPRISDAAAATPRTGLRRISQAQRPIASLLFATLAVAAGCDSASVASPRVPPSPVLTTVRLALGASPIEVGEATTATATALDQFGVPIATAPPTFTSATPQIAGVQPTTGAILAIAPGATEITVTIEGKSDRRTVTVTMAPIRLNEVNPNGDRPGGWVEFVNPTSADVDMSGWTVASGDLWQSFTIPLGATIPAGGYLAVNEGTLPLGLKAADAVHLFSRFGVQVDAYRWSESPATSYGRCPDGGGPFVTTTAVTRKAANACPELEAFEVRLEAKWMTATAFRVAPGVGRRSLDLQPVLHTGRH
jgi:hypothetical protein